ncbi:MAG: DUF4445 domain-containing protein [Anaerolineaceae bacterium]|nr:MAG: DUF4445 domain-containing protein [Anaerolineaceae bacterium]
MLCLEKRIVIRVKDSINNKDTLVSMSKGENLLETLASSKLSIFSECGGRGTCGKCIVKVVEGRLKITLQDKASFSTSELEGGYRLACMAYPDMDCTIILSSRRNTDYKVVTETLNHPTNTEYSKIKETSHPHTLTYEKKAYAIAIDLGTTTIALALTDLPGGNILDKYTAINPQRVYGADVVSRIKASNEGKLNSLALLIREELLKGILKLGEKNQIKIESIDNIVIAGNTTMIHLLMGYPCNTLGTFPFAPYKDGFINLLSDEIFGISEKIPITLIPGISVFVGGDITAGLLACGINREDKPCLFIDLGTNGEIALGNRERILATSTAAGPAFEGGNISCGVGSIPGAICHVSYEEGKLSYKTINEEPAVGLCGTGVVELISELLKEGIIDSSGLLKDSYFDEGYPIAGMKFIQKDIRELQLAKAAIGAGVDILVKSYGISYEEIDKVFIAGGFGYHLDINKAAMIGLIPEALTRKAIAVGNTSLAGAIYLIKDSDTKNKIEHIILTAEEVHLSNVEGFNELFMRYMSF